jgi:hypothetical protein
MSKSVAEPDKLYTLAYEDKHGDEYAWTCGPSVPLPFAYEEARRKIETLVEWEETPSCAHYFWTKDPDLSTILVPSKHAILNAIKQKRTGEERFLIWGHPENVAMGGYFVPDYQNPLDDRCIYIAWWWLERESDTEEVSKRIQQAEEYLYQHVEAIQGKLGMKTEDDQDDTREEHEENGRPKRVNYKHGDADDFWKDLQEWFDGDQEEITTVTDLADEVGMSRSHVSKKISEARERGNSNES